VRKMPTGMFLESPEVKCPYYRKERQSVIYCEGVERESCIHLAFGSADRRRDYERQFCEDGWSGCMIAAAHNRKWDYEV